MQYWVLVYFFMVMRVMIPTDCHGQEAGIAPDLLKLVAANKVFVYNRQLTVRTDSLHKNSLHLDAQDGAGIAWLPGILFTRGEITFDVRGKDLPQQSFVGLVFHGVNDTTYEAVYFRPFNFMATDSIKRSHAVQYISLPGYDWPLLREKFPNQYEQPLVPAPPANNWLHVRITVRSEKVIVYVNNNKKPSLEVTAIGNRSGNKMGFWTGNNSAGDFANLKMYNDN